MHPIRSLKRRTALFLVNHVLTGTRPCFFETKRRWLNSIGYSIGEGTKVVGPMECYAKLKVGRNCWLGKNLKINGNGTVEIGDNCDIGPEVTFQTGGGLVNYPRLLSSMDNPFSQTCQQPAFMFFYLREFICPLCRDISVIQKSGRNKL